MGLPDDEQLTRAFLQSCLDNTSAAVFAKDLQGRYLFFNRYFFELFRVDVSGKTDTDLFEPEVAANFRRVDLQVMESGTAVGCEERVPALDGEHVYWSVKFPLRDAQGNVYGVAGIASDITDRKRIERERDATLALLDTFLSGAPVGFAVFDEQLRYVRINETLAALNGVPVEQHLGRPVTDVLPELPDELVRTMRSVWETGQAVVNFELSLPTRAAPHNARSFLVSFYPIAIDGKTTALGAVLSDITAQKRASEQLEREAELRDLFMGVLAHDLRTPLASVTMSAQAMMLRDDMPEAAVRGAGRILRAAQRMNSLIKQVLDFSRVRAGDGLSLVTQEIDLGELCQGLLEEFRAARPERMIELQTKGNLRGRWDPGRLGQLLGNLVGNALNHGASTTPVVVHIVADERERVRVSVHNQGTPIAHELMATLFEPFRRGAPPTSRGAEEGLGLGLYIAERIAVAHGGRIEAESNTQETVFRVELPRWTNPV